MSHMHGSLKSYHDPNDPQNGPIEEDENPDFDPDAAYDARESAREHAEEWKSKEFEP